MRANTCRTTAANLAVMMVVTVHSTKRHVLCINELRKPTGGLKNRGRRLGPIPTTICDYRTRFARGYPVSATLRFNALMKFNEIQSCAYSRAFGNHDIVHYFPFLPALRLFVLASEPIRKILNCLLAEFG